MDINQTRSSILALARSQYTPALPRIPRLLGDRGREIGGDRVAVGMPVTRHPPHRSVREHQLIRLLPRIHGGQAHIVLLAAPDPAPVTRLPASVDGPCGAGPRSPWRGRFPPDSPPIPLRPCPRQPSFCCLFRSAAPTRPEQAGPTAAPASADDFGNSWPAWTPDGERLVFASNRSGA